MNERDDAAIPGESDDREAAEQGVAVAGRRLREAREARGFGVEEVGIRLHLDAGLIAALEEGDEDHLPAMTYVTGYVRAYARLLNLDENELARLAGSSVAPRDELLPENVDLGAPRRPRVLLSGLALALTLVLAAVALWWWLDAPPRLPSAEAVAEAPQAPPAPVAAAGTPAPASPVPEAPAAIPVTPVGTPPAQPATTEAPTAVTAPVVPLTFQFSEDSWLEVRDASGAVLAYAMMEAGTDLSLEGTPPFEVLLGYAPGVAITYNGQPFDTAPYLRGDVARLRIGAATP